MLRRVVTSAGVKARPRSFMLQHKREFWPIVAGGVAVIIASYAFRALKRLDEGEDAVGGGGSKGRRTAEQEAPKHQRIIGIDIGTENARAAMQRVDHTLPFILENREGHRATAAMVHFASKSFDLQGLLGGGRFLFKDDVIVGSSARNFRFRKPEQSFSGFDLFMGSRLKLDERAAMYSLMAADLVAVADNAYAEDNSSSSSSSNSNSSSSSSSGGGDEGGSNSVLTVPNAMGSTETSALVLACASAGMHVVATVPDAAASVAAAQELNLLPGKGTTHILVVDVGASMVQLGLVRLLSTAEEVGARLPLVIAETTLPTGGSRFDSAIVKYLCAEFEKKYPGINIIDDPMAKQRLFDAAEGAKHELSSSVNASINLPFLTADQSGPKHLEVSMSRGHLERLIESDLVEIERAILNNKSFSGIQIDTLLVVGGGARMPVVKSRLETFAKTRLKPAAVACLPPQPEDINALGSIAYLKLLQKLSNAF